MVGIAFMAAHAPDLSLAEGATLEVDEPEGQAWCMRCSTTVVLASLGEPCPDCQGTRLNPSLRRGSQLVAVLQCRPAACVGAFERLPDARHEAGIVCVVGIVLFAVSFSVRSTPKRKIV